MRSNTFYITIGNFIKIFDPIPPTDICTAKLNRFIADKTTIERPNSNIL